MTVALSTRLEARVFRATCSASVASDSVGGLTGVATLGRRFRIGPGAV